MHTRGRHVHRCGVPPRDPTLRSLRAGSRDRSLVLFQDPRGTRRCPPARPKILWITRCCSLFVTDKAAVEVLYFCLCVWCVRCCGVFEFRVLCCFRQYVRGDGVRWIAACSPRVTRGSASRPARPRPVPVRVRGLDGSMGVGPPSPGHVSVVCCL